MKLYTQLKSVEKMIKQSSLKSKKNLSPFFQLLNYIVLNNHNFDEFTSKRITEITMKIFAKF